MLVCDHYNDRIRAVRLNGKALQETHPPLVRKQAP